MIETRNPFGSSSVLANAGNVSQVLYSSSPIINTMWVFVFGPAARAASARSIRRITQLTYLAVSKTFFVIKAAALCVDSDGSSCKGQSSVGNLGREKANNFLPKPIGAATPRSAQTDRAKLKAPVPTNVEAVDCNCG